MNIRWCELPLTVLLTKVGRCRSVGMNGWVSAVIYFNYTTLAGRLDALTTRSENCTYLCEYGEVKRGLGQRVPQVTK